MASAQPACSHVVMQQVLHSLADAVGVYWRAAFSATGIICGFFLMTLVAVVNAYTSGGFTAAISSSVLTRSASYPAACPQLRFCLSKGCE